MNIWPHDWKVAVRGDVTAEEVVEALKRLPSLLVEEPAYLVTRFPHTYLLICQWLDDSRQFRVSEYSPYELMHLVVAIQIANGERAAEVWLSIAGFQNQPEVAQAGLVTATDGAAATAYCGTVERFLVSRFPRPR